MAQVHKRQYGVATTITFELFELDGVNFRTDAVFAAGDVTISIDEGAETNIASGFVDEGTGYSLPVSAAELQGARITIYIADQTGPKAWLDKTIIIETENDIAAQHNTDVSRGTLSGTHSATTADLGTNAPSNDIGGSLLIIPSRNFARFIDSYATGTGIATFASTGVTLTNADPWILYPAGPASEGAPIPASVTQFLGTAITETTAGRIAGNFDTFYDNGDLVTTQTVNDVGGGSSLTLSDIADAVWDEVLTAGTHNIVNSAGRILRSLEVGNILHADATQAGSTVDIVILNNNASNLDDFYSDQLLIINNQARIILDYVGSTRAATLHRSLSAAPSNNTDYEVSSMGPVFAAAIGGSYSDRAVHLSPAGSTTAILNRDGIDTNPIDDDQLANAKTIAAAKGLSQYIAAPGSVLTLDDDYTGWTFNGVGCQVVFNIQVISSAACFRLVATGVGTGTASSFNSFELCGLINATIPASALIESGIAGTITFNQRRDYSMANCIQNTVLAATVPIIDMAGDNITATNLSNEGYNGSMELQNLTATDSYIHNGFGTLIINANCSGTANITVSGHVKIINNSSIVINDDNNFDITDILSDKLAFNGADIALLSSGIISGAAATGTLSTTQATTDLTGYTVDQLIGRVIIWTSGAADGEATDITDYTVAGGLLTFTALTVAPANTDEFKIV